MVSKARPPQRPRRRQARRASRFCRLSCGIQSPLLFREELIRYDGGIVGYISSGVRNFTLGSSIGLGYVNHAGGVSRGWIDSGSWQIEIDGELFHADASLQAFFDPKGLRTKI
ncbi:glycine cleavage T C-terminal barrel domain-containing protein [Mesorhizobium kowhaii]|uniref:Glycine cleavage T C-terminal barrel domain-containing protein n=1 Tax=Mesorhizobium cantuariense TaxID=1300275 RepID=A0ABV7MJ49_9HYPH